MASNGDERIENRDQGERGSEKGVQPPISPEVVKQLYEKHSNELSAFLLGVLRDRDLTAEALQSTFVKAIESGHTATQNIRGWLFRVAYNEAMTIRRRQTIHKKALGKLNQSADLSWLQQSGLQASGFHQAVTAEYVQLIRDAIQQLPVEQQFVVKARIYDQKKFAEIASELGVPLGTVLTRMRLAMTKLATKIKSDD